MKTPFIAALVMILSLIAGSVVAQDAYRVRAGDTLRVEVIEDPTLNRSVLVSPDGRISVPLAGAIVAAGRPVETIQSDLANALAANFATPPSVFVSVERLFEPRIVPRAPAAPPPPPPTIDVYVLGEVRNPGKLEVAPGTSVLQLFAQMGGFSNFAATKRIQLRRTDAVGNESVFVLNYDSIESGLSPNGTATLADGDVIVVPQRRLFE